MTAVSGFVDVHSHVVPSGDDGARSVEAGLALCFEAARRGTRTLYGTPHVWPSLPLTAERERGVRDAHAEMAPLLAGHGLELRLGWELTPSEALLQEDPHRYDVPGRDGRIVSIPLTGAPDDEPTPVDDHDDKSFDVGCSTFDVQCSTLPLAAVTSPVTRHPLTPSACQRRRRVR